MKTKNPYIDRAESQEKFDSNCELKDGGIQEEQVDQDKKVHQLFLTTPIMINMVENFSGSVALKQPMGDESQKLLLYSVEDIHWMKRFLIYLMVIGLRSTVTVRLS
ncbi:hypothetical protein V6N13_114160 [Hibiscus sabdariffa]